MAFPMMLARGEISESLFNLLALVSVSLPPLAYIILAVIVLGAGAVQMF